MMNVLKQIVQKASFATTALVVIGSIELPANANNHQSQKCTYENNRTVCSISGSSSTRSSSSSSSSRTTTNVDISEKDLENLFHGIFNDRSRESSTNNQSSSSNSTTRTLKNERRFGW